MSVWSASIQGTVSGPRGLLADAEVKLLHDRVEIAGTQTDAQGAFRFQDIPSGLYQLQVQLPPLPPVIKEVDLSDSARTELVVNVELTPLRESITVTAGHIPLPVATTTSDVKILTEEKLDKMPYQALDDRLRSFPEFSLFRRSSSLVAQPTTQGVSLRGIGPSAVSRSLILLDGVPLNDAFGGWVYWDRIPLAQIQQVEVANGGQSSLYGNYGLGGVVQLLQRTPEPRTLDLQLEGGNKNSRKVGFFASHRLGPWGFSVSGSYFDFDGYPVVATAQRGAVDVAATSSHEATRFSIELAPSGRSLRWSLGGGYLSEDRGNGTPLTFNNTNSFDFSTGLGWSPGPRDQIEARAFFRRTIFDSDTSSVAADRNSERLVTQQTVPSVDGGASWQWYATRGRSRIAGGTDFWLVSGISADSVVVAGPRISTIRLGGGKQLTAGLYGELSYSVSPKTSLIAATRLDVWKNFDGRSGSYLPGNAPIVPAVPDLAKVEVSPSFGFSYDALEILSLHGSVYRSFRAPTLNELYRAFSAGNIVTNPNSGLVSEHSVGGEVGGRIRLTGTLRVDLSGFLNRLEKPVSNVTQQVTATQIIRQRQNLGNARIYGFQGTATWQPMAAAEFELSYLWDRATVTDFAADTRLVGKRLPQVPEHRLTMSSVVTLPQHVEASLIGRFLSDQFDDDLNTLVLDRFFQLDSNISRQLGSSARLFLSMENMTNTKILTARSPVPFVGTPFMIRGGVSFRVGPTK